MEILEAFSDSLKIAKIFPRQLSKYQLCLSEPLSNADPSGAAVQGALGVIGCGFGGGLGGLGTAFGAVASTSVRCDCSWRDVAVAGLVGLIAGGAGGCAAGGYVGLTGGLGTTSAPSIGALVTLEVSSALGGLFSGLFGGALGPC
jgi:hypothetical protein